ncbi:U-box-domain-containing protein [Trichocladium antarcticum]|uniref:U-box-domain-containing protein n=1 Tax=Trichocladium antarcticum TaxID=1450529 RepID=A0AAN6ZEI5_9PEZI|nr:U-box-domain-containing protein [Trichocladium antarcticum]
MSGPRRSTPRRNLIADPGNPALYTNRAMARLKLSQWDNAIADCHECLRLAPDSMKAHYSLSQAHLALRAYDDALAHALKAHGLCVAAADKSLATITAHVLRCKMDRWNDMERRRVRETSDLEAEMLAMLGRARDEAVREAAAAAADQDEGTRREIGAEWDAKIGRLRAVFEDARPQKEKLRVVPDWAIDDISFCFMADPVITKTGKSYERASIIEHLRRQPTDPLTREPLYPSELRPNLDLKQACDEFLAENGWAADW